MIDIQKRGKNIFQNNKNFNLAGQRHNSNRFIYTGSVLKFVNLKRKFSEGNEKYEKI